MSLIGMITDWLAHCQGLGPVTESVECWPPMREIDNLLPSRDKPVTYIIDTCHFLVWSLALIGENNDCLAPCVNGSAL